MNDIHIWALKTVTILVGGALLGGLIFLAKFERDNAAQIRLLTEAVNNDRKDMRRLLEAQDRIIRGLGWER